MTFAPTSWRPAVSAVALAAATLAAPLACGSDAETSGGGRGGSSGSAGTTDAGPDGAGAAGFGGIGGTSGVGGTGGADAGDAAACVHTGPPVADPSLFPVCPLCDNARCVPSNLVPAETLDRLADCADGTSKCVPDDFVVTGGNFLLETCRSLNDAEGRCVSLCVPQVQAQAGFLPTATCQSDERCAPCFDPTTGESTGACNLACDPGPTEPPKTFTKCCGGIGSCVPTSAVPTDLQSKLGADSCVGTDELCAPDDFVDPTFKPATCRSVSNAEGRCIPACVPQVASQASFLPKDSCPDEHLCAPCFDPTTGEDTGSCTLNGDMPTEPPVTFTKCCKELGSCVPQSIVPTAQRSFLGPDTCAGSGELCAPNALIDSSFTPPLCTSVNGAEGRCLPDCLPAVAAQASQLPKDTCDDDHLCAPCYDPVSAQSTGACTLNGDMPMNPPTTFDKCCGGIGSCVPTTLVPTAQQALLGTDTCAGTGVLCAPDTLTSSSAQPPRCTSLAGAEGRCLADCIPAVAAQASLLPRDVCAAQHLCAPCFDPTSGTATGACSINGDMPTEPPVTFDPCCGGIGSCVPRTIVPPAQQSLLGTDTCTGASDLCAPNELTSSSFQPPSCSSVGGFEGRCLPACLPPVAAQAARLPRDTCAATHLCTPCYDPISAADTGACKLNGDTPAGPPQTFENCCGGLGSCVPPALVPPAQQSLLGRDTCSGTTDLCAPDQLADSSFTPPSCSSLGGVEGRCLPSCLPSVAARASQLPRGTCATGHLCAPCFDPITGTSTGACGLNGDAPVNPPVVFQKCCPFGGSDRGTCIPTTALTSGQVSSLPVNSCPNDTWRCVPNLKVSDPSAKFPTCSIPNILPFLPPDPGACVPDCIITDPLQLLVLQRRSCAAGELCAPCTNPLGGGSTGACD